MSESLLQLAKDLDLEDDEIEKIEDKILSDQVMLAKVTLLAIVDYRVLHKTLDTDTAARYYKMINLPVSEMTKVRQANAATIQADLEEDTDY